MRRGKRYFSIYTREPKKGEEIGKKKTESRSSSRYRYEKGVGKSL